MPPTSSLAASKYYSLSSLLSCYLAIVQGNSSTCCLLLCWSVVFYLCAPSIVAVNNSMVSSVFNYCLHKMKAFYMKNSFSHAAATFLFVIFKLFTKNGLNHFSAVCLLWAHMISARSAKCLQWDFVRLESPAQGRVPTIRQSLLSMVDVIEGVVLAPTRPNLSFLP